MGLTILDDSMSSDQCTHTARRVPGGRLQWEVSWLPGRTLDRDSAITAMVLADVTSTGAVHPLHHFWPQIENWAAELGLTGSDVLTRTAEPADPEAAG